MDSLYILGIRSIKLIAVTISFIILKQLIVWVYVKIIVFIVYIFVLSKETFLGHRYFKWQNWSYS
jgi:hypothetical protein